jgi:hypothetical protein
MSNYPSLWSSALQMRHTACMSKLNCFRLVRFGRPQSARPDRPRPDRT